MSTEITWDPSRMEFRPVEMSITYEGGMQFTASNPSGISIPMDAHLHLGGGGKIPNPIDYLIASLGGCVGIKILLSLSDKGIIPDKMTIGIHATRNQTLPAIFNQVHLVITICSDVDDKLISEIISRTITHLCPIAAMFAEVGEVTTEHHIIRR